MVRNHVGLEELGIPGVSIVQEGFVDDAKASGQAYRLPNPALAVTPHVFTSLTTLQARQAVDSIIGDIIKGLTKPLPNSKESVNERITTPGSKDAVLKFTGRDSLECFEKMNNAFLDWGWSDGFPLIPPTEEKVKEMLGGTTRSPDEIVVDQFVPGMAQATVKNIAINAVMAGCKPEFLPVIITAIEAMHELKNLRIMTMSTTAHAPLFIVNGPIAHKLKINSGLCALGPVGPGRLSFANVAIGRAVRLNLMNIGNCYPGVMDQDTIGTPAKFGMVLAESEKANPWEPYHVEKGFKADQSTVSCCYGYSLTEMADQNSDTSDTLMLKFARHIKGIAGTSEVTKYSALILLAPDHARILARDGWTKDDMRQFLHLHCRIPAGEYRRTRSTKCLARERKWLEAADPMAMMQLYERPENFQVVVVGGMAGKSEAFAFVLPGNPHPVKA